LDLASLSVGEKLPEHAYSKLHRRLSESVGCDVEIVTDSGDVFYGLLDSFEMSKSYVILALKASKGLQFMNFGHIRYFRVASLRNDQYGNLKASAVNYDVPTIRVK